MRFAMKYPLLPLLLLFGLLFSGCASSRAGDEHRQFDLADKPTFYKDQWVQRNPPEVYVQPLESATFTPRVLFVPFRVTQQLEDSAIVGYTVARVIWQTWSTMELFPFMEFTGDDTPYRRDRAVQLGRLRKADVVVGGFVTHVYAGGTAGDNILTVQIEAYDTYSGQMIWSIGQGGLLPGPRTNDYLLFAVKTRQPTNPIQAIARAIAGDTGKIIQSWMSSPPAATRAEELDESVKETLYPLPDPVPAPKRQDADRRPQF